MHKYCLTYFLVKYDINNFDMKEFASKLSLDYDLLVYFSTDSTIEIGRNELYQDDINIMIRESLKDLLGKEDILLELKNKYNLEYYLERVPLLLNDDNYIKLSLDIDIIEFMYKTKTIDDLDYHLH